MESYQIKRQVTVRLLDHEIEISKFKKDSLDFVLWKPSEKEDPGWESPWGRGRPGWHLECSVMSEKFLGKKFDIHGGGLDLNFSTPRK